MNRKDPIGVFDSGIGGLSVLLHIRRLLLGEDLIYLADNRYVPYGDKGDAFVRWRSAEIVIRFIDEGAKAIVVACNTATAAAVDDLRRRFELPIVAMEPAVKPAAAGSRSDVIAVLATAGTLGSERYAALKDRHGRDVRVIERACHHWVELVERGELDGNEARARVREELQPLLAAGADALVLGCTHFPFLLPLIQEQAGARATVIDPAPAVACELQRRLRELELSNDGESGKLHCLYTGEQAPNTAFLPVEDRCPGFTRVDW